MNNYFIIHGSFGTPFSNWIPWLQNELQSKGNSVVVPQFPIGVGLQNYDNWSRLMKYYVKLGMINKNTIIIGHSIAPIFITHFLIENKIKVRKLIFVCGFNNYFGINEDYDTVNESMYCDNIEKIHHYCDDIICFYTNNDPYVKYEAEKEFADKVADKQIIIPNGGHLNKEAGYIKFKELLEVINNK